MRDLRTVDARPMPGQPLTFDVGIFTLFNPRGEQLRIIATVGEGWDHISVSLKNRCPTWEELEDVKRRFFHDHETAMQLHVPPADHINNSPYCLHLWRPLDVEIPRPPGWMVGLKGNTPDESKAVRLGVFHK